MDYTITFACYNSVEYTKLCVNSMIECGTPLSRLVIVDNGSTDDTHQFLEKIPSAKKIYNRTNLGCGVAWNQGALENQSEWTIIMNNDVIVSNNWVDNLIKAAIDKNLKIISPALIEGALDYNFNRLSHDASALMHSCYRMNFQHAVCLAVHKSVWIDIGYFQATPKLLGYEDTLFFNAIRKANLNTAITGRSWIHHFGSITQSQMKQEKGLNSNANLGNRYNYKLLQQSWISRKFNKIRQNQHKNIALQSELAKYNMSVHGLRKDWGFHWI